MTATATKPKRTRRPPLTGPEEFFVETIVLRPIVVEDPDAALMEAVEAARILQVKKPTVTAFMDRGTLSVIRRTGSPRRWLLRDEVLALAEQRGVSGAAREG